jgi:hypothetical protein
MSGLPDRVRLLIDGDNTSHDLIPALLRLLGDEVEGHVLCNPCSHSGWAGALKRTPSRIRLVRVPSRDKNAVDDRLMDLMRDGRDETPVLLVTRDSDFSLCVDQLERDGTPVICLSTEPPAVRLRRACSGWVELLRSGEAHYHVRTRLQGPANETPKAPKSAQKGRRPRKGRKGAPSPAVSASEVDPDALLARVLKEEGVTPLPRLEELCAPLSGVEAHVRSRPDLYHLSGAPGQLRVSLMTPERSAYLVLEATLRESGRIPLDQLIVRARKSGFKSSHLPHKGFRRSLEARPDRFLVVQEGDQVFAELIG